MLFNILDVKRSSVFYFHQFPLCVMFTVYYYVQNFNLAVGQIIKRYNRKSYTWLYT